MSSISDLVTRLRDMAVEIPILHADGLLMDLDDLTIALNEACDVIEHLQRVGRERHTELSQVRLENDVLRMEKKR